MCRICSHSFVKKFAAESPAERIPKSVNIWLITAKNIKMAPFDLQWPVICLFPPLCMCVCVKVLYKMHRQAVMWLIYLLIHRLSEKSGAEECQSPWMIQQLVSDSICTLGCD